MQISYLEASSIATATATVIPTMGLLPAPRKTLKNIEKVILFLVLNYQKDVMKKSLKS